MDGTESVIIRHVEEKKNEVFNSYARNHPFITLTYAQSLDASITAAQGEKTLFSNRRAQRMTHMLRACHDAILVGVNTVLVDNPQLNVRLVTGRNPRPIVLDSELRFPLWSRLLSIGAQAPLIVTTNRATKIKESALKSAGAEVIRARPGPHGQVDVPDLLRILALKGMRSIMVEGGSRVINSFLRSDLVDLLIVTIAPVFVIGPRVIDKIGNERSDAFPQLFNLRYEALDDNLIVIADCKPYAVAPLIDSLKSETLPAEFPAPAFDPSSKERV